MSTTRYYYSGKVTITITIATIIDVVRYVGIYFNLIAQFFVSF